MSKKNGSNEQKSCSNEQKIGEMSNNNKIVQMSKKLFIMYYFRVRLGYDNFWAELCG